MCIYRLLCRPKALWQKNLNIIAIIFSFLLLYFALAIDAPEAIDTIAISLKSRECSVVQRDAEFLEDVIRVSKCLSLKVRLADFANALQELIDSLTDRAHEARREDLPSMDSCLRFRERFHECIHSFWRSVGCPETTASGGTARKAIYDLTTRFSAELIDVAPGSGRCIIDSFNPSPSPACNWSERLTLSAEAAEGLVRSLQPHLESVLISLEKKADLHASMDAAIQGFSEVI